MEANDEIVNGLIEGYYSVRLVPVFGKDETDILYVRVRTEACETDDDAITRAERIAARLTWRVK